MLGFLTITSKFYEILFSTRQRHDSCFLHFHTARYQCRAALSNALTKPSRMVFVLCKDLTCDERAFCTFVNRIYLIHLFLSVTSVNLFPAFLSYFSYSPINKRPDIWNYTYVHLIILSLYWYNMWTFLSSLVFGGFSAPAWYKDVVTTHPWMRCDDTLVVSVSL